MIQAETVPEQKIVVVPSFLERVAEWIEIHSQLIAGVICALYLIVVSIYASRKMIWDDELFTLFIAGARDLGSLWQALATGADQHPPTFYFITRGIFSIFDIGHLTLRVPAILGVGVLMVCLYRVVSERTSPIFGLAAMLFPIASNVFYYAAEGRGYGLVLGFGSLAIVLWLKSTEFPHRHRYATAMGFCLAAAVGSHYYAVLLLIPIAAGEVALWFRVRRARISVPLACATALLPIAVFVPIVRSASGWSAHFWARPEGLMQPIGFYMTILRSAVLPLVIVLIVAAILSGGRSRHSSLGLSVREYNRHEAVFFLTLVCLPFAGYLLAVTVTHGYHARYVIIAVFALFVLLSVGIYRAMSGSRTGGLVFMAALTFACSVNIRTSFLSEQSQRRSLHDDVQLFVSHLDKTENVVVSEVTVFHRLSFYAPRNIARRLVYAADPLRSVQYLGHDTIDRGLLMLHPWFPERIEPYKEVLKVYPTFLTYGYIGPWTWLTSAMADDGVDNKLLKRHSVRLLFRTRTGAPAAPPSSDRAFGPSGEPVTGDRQTLCEAWTNDGNCYWLSDLSFQGEAR